MMRKSILVSLAVIIAGALLALGCQPREERKSEGPPLKLTIAVRPAPDSGLIALADEKGYFREAGVEVSINLYPAGILALEAMSRGEADLATVADIAFATRMFTEKSIRVVASIGVSTGSQIIARKDRGIQAPSDLKGKRIGFSPDTTSDYFLYTFLLTENIPPAQIIPVQLSPGSQAQAVINGEVDAVSAFDVFAFEARKCLGENAIAWDCQNSLGYQWILAANESIAQNSEATKRFLRALTKAEKFALANEKEAEEIIIRKLKLDPELAQQAWSKIRLSVSLSQSIITSLRDYVRWKMDVEGKTGSPPNVLDFIYTGAMDDVAPKSVTIFR